MKKGWEVKKLKEIAEYSIGLTYSPKDVGEAGIVVLRSSNIQEGKLDFADIVRVNKKVKNSLIVKDGDILMCSRNGSKRLVGKTATIAGLTEEMTFGTFMTIIRSPYNPFLSWFFNSDSFREQIGGGENTMINQVTKYMLDEVTLPFPPLAEQQRIVAILDEAFAAIAKAKANAEQNLKNAKELFESYLQGVFEQRGEGWEDKTLGELCSVITKGSSPKWQGVKYVDSPGILFVTSENVGEGRLLLEIRKYVEEKFNVKDRKSILKKGDVLTNIVGASIGRTAIYSLDDIANINQAVCILRCRPELISNFYLMNLLNSPFLKVILHSNEVNAARANLSLGFFSNLLVPLPSLKEQLSIVQKLDALSVETKRLEAIYQQKIASLDELKKTVLQKAFRGELNTERVVRV